MEGGAQRLAALDPQALRLGLKRGQSLADARALCPALVVAEADPDADAAMLAAVADWCRRWTPLAALDAPDGAMLDVTGCAHLFGGEGALLRAVEDQLAAQGWTARAAVASTPACAWALARHGFSGVALPPGAEARSMRDLPVAALRIPQAAVDQLGRMGLSRVGDLLERPRAPLAARFGEGLLRRLDEAAGVCVSPIAPRADRAPYVAERRFFEPIATQDDILRTAETLAVSLCRSLERHGEGARQLELTLFRVDGAVRRAMVGLGRPTRDPRMVAPLFRERLAALADEIDPGFGFDVVRLSALRVDSQDAAQPALDAAAEGGDIPALLDRLGARLGVRRVQGFAEQDAYVPEFAVRVIAAAAPVPRAAPSAVAGSATERPLRLFATAERIEAMSTVPDGPPLNFRWRRAFHLVRKAEGPERIAPEWWRSLAAPAPAASPETLAFDEDEEDEVRRAAFPLPGPPRPDLTRDYFRVEDSEGRRFWLYREGLYGEGALSGATPRWFLHGLFA